MLRGKPRPGVPSLSTISNDLIKAKNWLYRKAMGRGGICPLCERYTRVQPRPFNKTMASCLIWLVLKSGKKRKWVDIAAGPKGIVRTKQLSTAKYWGLIERKPNTDPSKKTSGIWRPTKLGVDFAYNRVSIPHENVIIYDDQCFGFKGRPITIVQAMKTKFHYQKMMRLTP